jgi:hypothetical protein
MGRLFISLPHRIASLSSRRRGGELDRTLEVTVNA